MKHLATVLAACHLLVTLFTLPAAAGTDRYSHTSPLVCMRGRDRSSYVDIDCHHTVTPSLISVTRVIHGLTPNTSGCDVTAPRATCCPDLYDPARDCVFSSEEEVRAVKARCDRLVTCETSLDRATVDDQCPATGNGATFGRYSDFARVEFVCASTALLGDVCAANTTVTGDHVFLETNFLRDNRHHSNKTCSCVITTGCRNSLIFKVLDLDLSRDAEGRCRERVVVTEGGGGGVLASLNCSYDPLLPGNAGTTFTSQSSVATFDLDVTGNNTGRVLVLVTATQGAPVEVVCGQPARQSLLTDSHCSAPTTPPSDQDVSSPLYNTTRVACLQGRDISHDFEITCLNKGAPGLISVERILHALTPDVMGCDVTAPRNSCCPGYDPARDCVFSSQEGLAELRKKCDGSEACYPSLRRATVNGACPPSQDGALTYGAYSHSAWVEFSCINTGLLGDVCDAGSTTQHTELYLESNVYHVNSQQRNTSCTCHVTAPCRQSLVFTVLQLALTSNKAGRCLETVVMEDGGNSSLTATLDCSHNQLDEGERGEGEGGGVFVSQSNIVIFSLHLPANHTGKILFRVTASDGGMLEARCGRTTELDVWDQHRCTSVTPQPQPTSYTRTSMTSTLMSSTAPGNNFTGDLTAGGTTKGGNYDDNDSSLNTGVAIGVSVVAFLVVLLTIIVIVVIWRSKKRSPDDAEDHYIVRYVGPDPEPLAIVNPSLASHYDNVANTVRDPPHSQREKHVYDVVVLPEEGGEEEGAVGGVANPIYDYARHVITSDKEKW